MGERGTELVGGAAPVVRMATAAVNAKAVRIRS
jgi:hypothetical protein